MRIYKFNLKKPASQYCVVKTQNHEIVDMQFGYSNVGYSNIYSNVGYSNIYSNVGCSNIYSNVGCSNVGYSNLYSNVGCSNINDIHSVSSYSWDSSRIGVEYGVSGSEGTIEHTVESLETLFEEIIKTIVENEVNSIQIPANLSEGYLTREIYNDIINMELNDETSSISSGAMGFTSLSSSESETSNWPFENLERQMYNLLNSIKIGSKYFEEFEKL